MRNMNRAIIKELLRDLREERGWTRQDREAIDAFIGRFVDADHRGVVHEYLELVRKLAAATGQDKALVFSESSHLIGRLDPNAYASEPPGQVLDPVVFVDRRQRNARIQKRVEAWIADIPNRLQLLHAQLTRTDGRKVFDFPTALLELVRAVPDAGKIPPAIHAVCTAIRLGRTCMTAIDPPGLAAFHWPLTEHDFDDLLTEKDALAFLKQIGIHVSPRTLANRAKDRPALKQDSKYVRDELRRAARDGCFGHRNKKSG
jgi:hypothetical protein